MLRSDVLIYDLGSGSADDVDSLVKLIREKPDSIKKQWNLILISSVMGWANTPQKVTDIPKEN
jgi:hypothetical protein